MAKPRLGESVDEVMRRFMEEADAWCGIQVVEAVLVLSNAGPAIAYRVQAAAGARATSRIGIAVMGGWGIRDATESELVELEDGIAAGFVQVVRYRQRGGESIVLHQADGRELPRRQECALAMEIDLAS